MGGILDFTDVKNVKERREGKGRRGQGSVFYLDVVQFNKLTQQTDKCLSRAGERLIKEIERRIEKPGTLLWTTGKLLLQ